MRKRTIKSFISINVTEHFTQKELRRRKRAKRVGNVFGCLASLVGIIGGVLLFYSAKCLDVSAYVVSGCFFAFAILLWIGNVGAMWVFRHPSFRDDGIASSPIDDTGYYS